MRLLVILTMAGLLLAGCSAEKKAETADTSMSNDQLAAGASGMIIGEFGKELKGELMAAMNEGGAVNALSVCQMKAPEIAAGYAAEGAWTIARVTDRPRNPEDQATDAQLVIMARFADTTNGLGNTYAEWKVDSLGDSSYCYYQAIRTADLCLNCHGPADKLAPGVAEKLAGLYPEDKATGYAAGDLRGMFVVTMNWPQAKQAAENLLKGPDEGEAEQH